MTKIFVAMPFAQEFDPVYSAIRAAADMTGVEVVRGDESLEPGPIVSQRMRDIGDADFVIAEVSSSNPNVYYEVGLAHCSRKPTLLLADQSSIGELPFDIKHNRVITYRKRGSSRLLEDGIARHLQFLLEHYCRGGNHPSREAYFSTLSDGRQSEVEAISSYIATVSKEFDLQGAKLMESRYSPEDGYILTVRDAFGEKGVFSVDINGLIRQKKRLN